MSAPTDPQNQDIPTGPPTLRLGGVPEHFNEPVRSFLEGGNSVAAGVEWLSYPGGTGAMVADLKAGTLDIALALTEGVVRALDGGLDARLLGVFVSTPLEWGIHTGVAHRAQSVKELEGGVFAISRRGSGSELMTHVLAHKQGWQLDRLRYVQVGHLEGGLAALEQGEADAFLWERTMTEPFVRTGRARLVDVLPTPWPAFVAVARREVIEGHGARVRALISGILHEAVRIKHAPDTAERIAQQYGLSLELTRQWLAATEWGDPALPPVPDSLIETCRSWIAPGDKA